MTYYYLYKTTISANFADYNTLYKCCGSLIEAKSSIKIQYSSIISWFKANSMKTNPEKCYAVILGDTNIPEDFTVQIMCIEILNLKSPY